MCKMSLKEIGDMQLSRQTATDWGHGMKQHGALMSRKSKARATILSCVDILQEKWSQRTFIAPLTRSSLITKLHMLFTTMFAYCISSSACCLDPCCLLRSVLSGWLFPREVGLENPGWVCERESDAGGWCSYMDCTGHKPIQSGQTHRTNPRPLCCSFPLPSALTPCETQVCNWHKELIPKAVSTWSDHLVCPQRINVHRAFCIETKPHPYK